MEDCSSIYACLCRWMEFQGSTSTIWQRMQRWQNARPYCRRQPRAGRQQQLLQRTRPEQPLSRQGRSTCMQPHDTCTISELCCSCCCASLLSASVSCKVSLPHLHNQFACLFTHAFMQAFMRDCIEFGQTVAVCYAHLATKDSDLRHMGMEGIPSDACESLTQHSKVNQTCVICYAVLATRKAA